jgi:hypothetical protein
MGRRWVHHRKREQSAGFPLRSDQSPASGRSGYRLHRELVGLITGDAEEDVGPGSAKVEGAPPKARSAVALVLLGYSGVPAAISGNY